MQNLTRETLTVKSRQTKPAVPPATPTAPLLLTRFWFVWAPDALRPKRRHASLGDALTEARRLRGIAPERRFIVYKAIAIDEAALSAAAQPPNCPKCGGDTELRRCSVDMAGFQCQLCSAKASDWLPHVALADVDIAALPEWVRS